MTERQPQKAIQRYPDRQPDTGGLPPLPKLARFKQSGC
jgi:hypothetical protein